MPEMLARGSGRIVNMGSPGSFAPWPGATGYTAARFAMRGFTAALRADLDGTGIGVTLVVPGEVRSAYFDANPGTAARLPRAGKFFPVLTPEQVAAAIVRARRAGQRAGRAPVRAPHDARAACRLALAPRAAHGAHRMAAYERADLKVGPYMGLRQ